MVRTKGLSATVKNWEGSIGVIPGRYRSGVEATNNWKARATAGDDLWKTRTSEAIANNSRQKGLDKVSDSDWKNNALGKGASRIGPGIRAAVADYSKGMAAVLSAIESVSLPDRVADPEQNVINRVVPIVKALRALKG